MNLNNHVDRSNPIQFLLEIFPLATTLLEFGEAIVKTIEMSYGHGYIIHIPIHFVTEIIGLTIIQYALAFLISCKSGYSKHSVNAVLELALLVYCIAI
jgi:hypothetical protein